MLWLCFGVHKIYSEEEQLFQTLQAIWWFDYSDEESKDSITTSADLPYEKGEQNQSRHWHLWESSVHNTQWHHVLSRLQTHEDLTAG